MTGNPVELPCPHCGRDVNLDDALAAPLSRRLEADMARAYEQKIAAFRAEEAARQKAAMETAFADLRGRADEQQQKLTEAKEQTLQLLREKRALEEQQKDQELIIERRLQEEAQKIRQKVEQQQLEEHQLKAAEYEKQIGDLRRQIENLKHTSDLASQQSRGEVLELALEDVLRGSFPEDAFEEVPKGRHGGDIVQIVKNERGAECGRILWETKRTKSWSDGWLEKLREDQRQSRCDLSILASAVLPKSISGFGTLEGIWVTALDHIVPVATILRHALLQVAAARQASAGRATKMDLVYEYLSGPEFRRRIEGIVDAFQAMRSDLDQEKRAMARAWAKREKQIERVLLHTAGMHGELGGIIGSALPDIAALSLPTGGEDGGELGAESE